MAGNFEPVARCGHVAATVENKVYVWGGCSELGTHDPEAGPYMSDIIVKVDILDLKVSTDASE